MNYHIDNDLYWHLPGPRVFKRHIINALKEKRGIFINIPEHFRAFAQSAIISALKYTNLFEDKISLVVTSSTDIDSDIGVHLNKNRISAGQLASLNHTHNTVIILTSVDDESRDKCEKFAVDFIKSSTIDEGNIKLIVQIQDEQFQKKLSNGGIEIIPFDGGLKTGEIDAYVNLRMMNRDGPDDTQLYKTIISEFSGYDSLLAERLMTMSNNQIIYIRDYLQSIMEENIDLWRHKSWLNGTHSIVTNTNHILRDVYLRYYGTDKQCENALQNIDKRYWKACLKSITPWLEEKRHQVFKPLMPIVKKLAKNDEIEVPAGNRMIPVHIKDLEYGNVSGLIGASRIKLKEREQLDALRACRSAKIIRDEISHLRAPSASMVNNVFSDIENVLLT